MKTRNKLFSWFIHLVYLVVFTIASSAFAANCPPDHYDDNAKKEVTLFLKEKYGNASNAFDVNRPSLINLDSNKKPKFPPDSVSYVGIEVRPDQHIFKSYTVIVIGFERCTNKIVDSFELH